MDKKENLIGQATTEQINAWKEQHGDIFAFKVDGHICYLRKPTRRDLSFASSAGKKDPLKFNESLIRRDDDKFMGASGLLEKIIPDAEAELEKL